MSQEPVRNSGQPLAGSGLGRVEPEAEEERQRLERELWQSHQRFQAILDTTSDGYWRATLDGRITDVNQAYCLMSGYSREELLGMTVPQLDALDRPEQVRQRAEQLQRERTLRFTTRHRTKDGRLLDIEVSATLVPATQEVVAFLRDHTERNRTQDALFESQGRFKALVQNSWDILSILDADGHLVYNSPACERIHGFTPEELLGRSTADLIHPDDASRVAETMGWILQHPGEPATVEYRYACKDGHWVWMEAVGVNYLDHPAIRGIVANSRDISERKRAEAALRESEQKFLSLMEAASIPIGVANTEGRIEYLNPRFMLEFGYRREDLPDMETWWRRAYPDPAYRQEAMGIWQAAFDHSSAAGGDASMDPVFHVTCGNGQVRQVKIHAAVAGERIIVFLQDLTDWVRSEASLRDALELGERLVAAQPLGVLAYHAASGRCVRANEAIARTVGASIPELLAQNFRSIPSWQTSGLLAAAEKALATGTEQHLETRLQTTFGKACWVSAFFSVFQAGGEPHLLMLSEDITTRMETEAALRKVSAAVDQSPASIIITDKWGAIEYVNAAFTRITGYSAEEALGKTPRILKSGFHDNAFYQDLWNTVLDGRTWAGRIQNRRKDGALFWVEGTISPLRNEAGEITHLVSSNLDITEMLAAAEAHLRLEEQLVRTQKLESLGSLAGGVAHDMNNVLGAILGLASMHQDALPEGSALRRDMDTIVKACERGGTLVKGLLGFARQGLAEEADVDLNSLVTDEVALLSRTTLQRVHLDMDLAEDLPLVRGDASALSHVLMNLCVNAVDAMAGGGTLSLRTHNPGTGFVVLEVSDTGCGMPKEVLDKALEPFFTTKPQGRGTGLGLPIVYGTVKAHRGRLEIESAPGKGTRVTLFLPALQGTTEARALVPTVGQKEGSLAILLVDDDELVQDSVGQMLAALGHRPTSARSGEEALEQLKSGLPADVVILDLNMPGLGGAATLPLLRSLCPDLPVILATGRVDQDALDLAQKFPGVTLMPKPFTLADVRRHLEPISGK
ncbi:MAG TPA: PAS domain S-box protein [Geothrix sp.]|nr:PAS domain S-box protein [Geothrix sp.]